ncbi:hypothetical protein WA026_019282 [Henosepilachna vigintioctopunctata]|uniref:Protein kinase domain-containing protein n=1 Tax=Henosepilachna vigintioctopunctata TaxID=420089 RepID=A0AAW1UA75_9CUCU
MATVDHPNVLQLLAGCMTSDMITWLYKTLDPSSLRKHVKTVHGAEFYANKKHKGVEGSSHDGSAGLDSSPDVKICRAINCQPQQSKHQI